MSRARVISNDAPAQVRGKSRWRRGETNFLESALTRAVLFSAQMTATAFGSLWLSAHPGTSSMGKLLALSLLCTLASAALFQPALMGPPRKAPI